MNNDSSSGSTIPTFVRPSASDLQSHVLWFAHSGNDSDAAAMASTLLKEENRVSQMHQRGLSAPQKASELLELFGNHKHRFRPIYTGAPQTLTVLWHCLIEDVLSNSKTSIQSAKLLLRPMELSEDEKTALKAVLKELFTVLTPKQTLTSLFVAIAQTNTRSEPIVVRAFLLTIAQKCDDATLVQHVARWKLK